MFFNKEVHMLVPCPFRRDHKTNNCRPHGPSQCPPPPGKHGDRYHSLSAGGRKRPMKVLAFDERGVSVAGIHNAGASSPNRGKKKSEAEKMKGGA